MMLLLTTRQREAAFYRLFRQIEHGDAGHRDWLWAELRKFFRLAPCFRPQITTMKPTAN